MNTAWRSAEQHLPADLVGIEEPDHRGRPTEPLRPLAAAARRPDPLRANTSVTPAANASPSPCTATPAVPDHLGQRTGRVDHHRCAAGERLEGGQTERLDRPRRHHDVSGGEQGGQLPTVGDKVNEPDGEALGPSYRRSRNGPSPATTRTASTPAARNAERVDRPAGALRRLTGRSGPTAPARAGRTGPRLDAGSWRPGWNRSRSTPSGTRTTLDTPSRSNSAAAHDVVHSTVSYWRAVRALSRSVTHRRGGPASQATPEQSVQALVRHHHASDPLAGGPVAPVQRRVNRSDTSSRSGASSSSRASIRRRPRMTPSTASERHRPAGHGDHPTSRGDLIIAASTSTSNSSWPPATPSPSAFSAVRSPPMRGVTKFASLTILIRPLPHRRPPS